ncbi:MAG: hypothetical protein ABI134_30745 [Byssovorax sp.]
MSASLLGLVPLAACDGGQILPPSPVGGGGSGSSVTTDATAVATAVTSTSSGMGGASSSGTSTGTGGESVPFPHTLYVAHEGSLVAYDIATGAEIPGSVEMVSGPRTMQAMSDGTVLLNNTKLDQIVAAGGRPTKELARYASSAQAGKKPVEGYISPTRDGKTYWLTLNDGNNTAGSTSATLVDASQGSPSYLKPVAELAIPNGHHQAAFSATRERLVVSSYSDCQNLLEIFDYSTIASVTLVGSMTAASLGFDGSTMAKTCDPTESAGVAMKPHGCATAKKNGKVYCNFGGPGIIAVADIDADPPTYKAIQTTGKGGGYSRALPGSAYIYTIQSGPREGKGGASCQIGQLVTIDTSNDTLTSQIPLLYKGAGCTDALIGTDEETDTPNELRISKDGKTLFIGINGGFGIATARVRQEMVLDLTNPAMPVQLPSIQVGQSTGERGTAMTGDGKLLFVADAVDGTVTQIDVASRKVTGKLTVKAMPLMISTFGTLEGPSAQVGPVF